MTVRAGLGLVLWAALAAPATPGFGADEKPKPSPAKILMDEVEIRGEVERPEVFYIIPRRQVQLDLGSLAKDYRGEIMQPLLPGPFEEWVRSKRAAAKP